MKLKRQMRKIIFYLKNSFLPLETNGNLPYSLRPRALAFVVVLALLIKSVSFISWFAVSDKPFFADITSALVVYLSNQERQSAGVSPLKESSVLDQVARDKALDMLAKNYFSHNSPDGSSPWFWFTKNGYAYVHFWLDKEKTIGENNWKKYVKISKEFMRPAEVDFLIGDATKARKILNWKPKVSFKQLVKMMVDQDLQLLKKDSK